MCHLVLLMPLMALPVFWFMPLSYAAPTYGAVVLISVSLYWPIIRAMRKQPSTGAEGMFGVKAEVVSRLSPTDHAQYLVRSRGELWSANSAEALQPGEVVSVTSVDGIRLVVRRELNARIEAKGETNERYCH